MANIEEGYDSSSSSSESSPRRDNSYNKPVNIYKNDGSFLKVFQLLQEKEKSKIETDLTQTPLAESSSRGSSTSASSQSTSSLHPTSSQTKPSNKDPMKKNSLMSFVGRRRGGKSLPTGVVKKQRKDNSLKEEECKDEWSQYTQEVRKYNEISCKEEGYRRLLMK